jgi:hypothetical protein
VIGQNRLFQSRANDWAAEISLETRIYDGMPKAEVLALAKSAFAIGYQRAELVHQATRIEHSRRCIRLGHGERRITAFMFDPPNPFVEIHSEPGIGALTVSEAEAFSRWLHQLVSEMQPRKSRRALRHGAPTPQRSWSPFRSLWRFARGTVRRRSEV